MLERRYYDTTHIEAILSRFEARYGVRSADFYRAHLANEPPATEIPGWTRETWAGFYRTWRRMTDSGFAEQVDRDLAVA